MNSIKNIIFDLGGVLLDIDYNKTISAFKELGIENFEEMFSQLHSNALFEKLETGHISDRDFYETIKTVIPGPVSNEILDKAWNAMILGFEKEKLEFLTGISEKYKLFLLSNTNSIHLKYFRKIFTRDTGKITLDSYFSKTWYSHLIGLRKPYKEVYEFVLQDANLIAEETLFIDDTAANIDTALQSGLKTHLLLPQERIEQLGL